ncbi:MAG: CHAT domain-containing protein [Acaryochloris sp. RU_4_1]|nr:CHAT domain-containing protein [Acaryochloris sp. RU_4_1]NJR54498.1 CHAT domain-containing protein [Acaryochloris sp. CRU_2_0]
MGQLMAQKLQPFSRKTLRWVGMALCSACLCLGLGLGQSTAYPSTTLPSLARSPISNLIANRDTVSLPRQQIARSPEEWLQQGKTLFQVGQFAAAADAWSQATELYQAQRQDLSLAIALNQLTLAQQELGQWQQAQESISHSLEIIGSAPTPDKLPIYAQALNAQGSLQLAQGNATKALATWEKTTEIYTQIKDETGRLGSLINRAQAQQVLGLYLQSRKTLEGVAESLQKQTDPEIRATGYRSLGNVLRLVGDLKEAEKFLKLSLDNAASLSSPQEVSVTQLSLGNTARARNDYADALTYYQQAAQSPVPSTQLQAQLNRLSVLIEQENWLQAQQLWPSLQTQLADQPASRRNVYSQVNLVKSLVKLHQGSAGNTPSIWDIAEVAVHAVQQANSINDQQAKAYALGSLGHLYELDQQWAEAKKLTEQALLIAQANNASEISYQWQWQLGRILKSQKDVDTATVAYTGAFQTLEHLRKDLVATNPEAQFSFRDSVEPVYRELVDLLLSPTAASTPSQENLKQAREVMESLQLTELDNFFRSACLDGQVISIDKIDQQAAAVIYPILLRDRIELILSLPQQPALEHKTIPIAEADVEETVTQFRDFIEKPFTAPEGKQLGKDLYDWLIRPLKASIDQSQADTLVFVLDGSLRNVPLAALYDGQDYLIEQYALAIAPGMQLINTQPLRSRKLQIIAAGISEARKDYPALVYVDKELQEISALAPSEILRNEQFTSTALQKQIQELPYPVVHLATHGKFSSNAENTFVLAWDQEIGVHQLNDLLRSSEQVRQNPIELLVLSACETAAGDRRAALGLAGVSVRAGARSTLASLWNVDDQSTATLIGQFYQNLNQQNTSKAKALQQAQRKLIADANFRHPAHWSAFVLVGNWL